MSLIDDDVMPLDFFQGTEANSDTFETCDNDIKFSLVDKVVNKIFSFFLGCNKLDNSFLRQPFLDFVGPVTQRNFRSNDQERTRYIFIFLDEAEHGDCLDGLSESHIIGKDSVDSTFVEGDHPVESDELIVLELSALQN